MLVVLVVLVVLDEAQLLRKGNVEHGESGVYKERCRLRGEVDGVKEVEGKVELQLELDVDVNLEVGVKSIPIEGDCPS